MNLSQFFLRSVTALALGPIVLVIIWAGHPYFSIFIIAVSYLMLIEILLIIKSDNFGKLYLFIPIVMAVALVCFVIEYQLPYLVTLLVIIGFFLCFLVGKDNLANKLITGFSFLYILLFSFCILLLREVPNFGALGLFWFFAVNWASDIGAYCFGKCFGRSKMFPRISPGKTWIGSFGGISSAILVGLLFYGSLFKSLELQLLVLLCAGISIVGQFGDLIESVFKRRFGVKDSGVLLPGHGGILDRMDSILLTAPFVYILIFMYS